MNQILPDISQNQQPLHTSPLSWVGMQGIDLPLSLQQPSHPDCPINCKIDVAVNLPRSDIKGIHMSRLYQHCNQLNRLTATHLYQLLQDMISSHQSCDSSAAKINIQFELLLQRKALSSPDLSGWKAYPVQLQALLIDKSFSLESTVDVSYSSTCPCSAALSRQVIHDAFLADFSTHPTLSTQQISGWLLQNASLATPHSQRSIARVSTQAFSAQSDLNLIELIDLVEDTLQTATQTAVKRVDEQKFAKRNGENLMFVEDAARRLGHALSQNYTHWALKVDHQESLHPHNAVAYQHSKQWVNSHPDIKSP